MTDIDNKIEAWQKKLLDLGKKNRLVNFRETKRSTLRIIKPEIDDLYTKLAIRGNDLEFSYYEKYDLDFEEDDELIRPQNEYLKGDIQTNQIYKDQQATLRNLRYRAKTAIEEQGVNILYASFGLINYKENQNSTDFFSAPIILVPVKIQLESISSPFVLSLHDEEIVINPTLVYKLDQDFKIKFPEFEPEENNILDYLKEVEQIVKPNSWSINRQVNVGLFSFLKINIYKDIIKNKETIKNHFLIKALVEKKYNVDVPEELNNYDHDGKTSPLNTFLVVDADSSQQDAVLFAKRNISFVLQGPPGTGKSQTITNIIAEKLAEGKKVLFVSEKMAALEVVHKRLSQSNLDDFCLPLHSHRANKKQVLEILRKSLALQPIKVIEEARRELKILTDEREKLNNYVKELHTPVKPLGKTIYEVNGILAGLSEVQDVIFDLTDVRNVDTDKFDRYFFQLKELSISIGKMHEDYSSNPWRDCKLETLNFEMRHQIESVTSSFLPKLIELSNEVETTNSILELTRNESIHSLSSLINILFFSGSSKNIPSSWFFKEDLFQLIELANIYEEYTKRFFDIRDCLNQKYEKAYFSIPAGSMLKNLQNSIQFVQNNLDEKKYPDEEFIITNLDYLIYFVNKTLQKIQKIKELQKSIENVLDLHDFVTFQDVIDAEKLFGFFNENPKPTKVWLENGVFQALKNLFYEARENHEKVIAIHKDVLDIFEKEIFDLDYKFLLKKFKTEFNSPFRIFNSNYRDEKNNIRALALDFKKNFSYGEIITLLRTLQVYFELNNWISENDEKLKMYFGTYYKGLDTNWKELEDSIFIFENINSYFLNNKNMDLPKTRLLQIPENINQIRIIYEDLKSLEGNELSKEIENELSKKEISEIQQIDIINVKLEKLHKLLNEIKDSYNQISNPKNEKPLFKEIIEDLKKLNDYQYILYKFNLISEEFTTKFSNFYNGLNTNWETLKTALDWAKDFLALKTKYHLPDSFIEKICVDENVIAYAGEKSKSIDQNFKNINDELFWFLNLFEPKDDMLNAHFPELIERIQACVNNLSNLEEWVDYKKSRNKCGEIGLGDYVYKIEKNKLPSKDIVEIFKKQFFRKWLDEVLPEFPTVQSFRGQNQVLTINKFVNLDEKQLSIAQSRVRERILSNFPNWDTFTSASTELGILKREINKQRRIMPLRELFKEIPNLLMNIKPCLMMSPLSVSLFLESDHYNFDLVIFDEASQVRTEDAIGAVFRGKQVIVVGDSKQLPPTNFFWAGSSDENFDYDDDEDDYYDDSDAFESVLDEIVSVVPERTLRWHYRSRHEHLIAFSNVRIYHQSLITFPSVIEKERNNGVEFVYVPNGVYDRGGNRTNEKEAMKVAELVFEHFSNTPKRSLGVVTFSLAQAHAIEASLRKFRMQNNAFEEFFNEENEESFFVKNLESVQGDERDTIIISVGYAKDHNGSLSMNFGPLNRNGGFRRLNVVITRAKFNVKLVSSIQSADITLDNTENEGVRLLRFCSKWD
jgi:DNA polymerase III delta prime subunit